jgi:cytoskeleton protein RodZ
LERIVHSIGSKLRQTREAQGIKLEDAANVTRIGKNYLIALEEEMFDRLPSPAYVKGFLRVYSGFLGMSGDEIVSLYEKSLPNQQSTQPPEENHIDIPARPKLSLPAPLIGSIAVLSLIGLGFWFYSTLDSGKEVQRRVADNQPAHHVTAPVFPSLSSAKRDKGAAGIQPATANTETLATAPPYRRTGIILKLKVNQDCWLSITIDDSVSQQYDLKAGDLIEWKGEKGFALDLGNAAGVEAELNGRSLPPFGGQGKSAHVVLKDDSV